MVHDSRKYAPPNHSTTPPNHPPHTFAISSSKSSRLAAAAQITNATIWVNLAKFWSFDTKKACDVGVGEPWNIAAAGIALALALVGLGIHLYPVLDRCTHLGSTAKKAEAAADASQKERATRATGGRARSNTEVATAEAAAAMGFNKIEEMSYGRDGHLAPTPPPSPTARASRRTTVSRSSTRTASRR